MSVCSTIRRVDAWVVRRGREGEKNERGKGAGLMKRARCLCFMIIFHTQFCRGARAEGLCDREMQVYRW